MHDMGGRFILDGYKSKAEIEARGWLGVRSQSNDIKIGDCRTEQLIDECGADAKSANRLPNIEMAYAANPGQLRIRVSVESAKPNHVSFGLGGKERFARSIEFVRAGLPFTHQSLYELKAVAGRLGSEPLHVDLMQAERDDAK
jgi:hypothetical protein